MPANSLNPSVLFKDIAPAQFMQISLLNYSSRTLKLTAPLQPNINDKGTAFAGSISSLLVLTGWALVTLQLRDAGFNRDVVIAKNETHYKRPVRADMITEATIAPLDPLIPALETNQRGRIQVEIQLLSNDIVCATMTAQYVILPTQNA
jgi:thioesterase domain-containing protein